MPVFDRDEPILRRKFIAERLAGKISKEDANYRNSQSNSKEMCGECDYYQFPGQPTSNCKRVAGVVEAEDVCDYFYPRRDEVNVLADQGQRRVQSQQQEDRNVGTATK